jgi:zinc transport system permease protein
MDRLYTFLADLAAKGALPEALRYPFVARGLLAVLILAPLLGGMSHLVVARRLAFFSTALGQAALTGLTLGLLAGEPINAPYAGIYGFCLASALLMTFVKRRSRLPPDTLIGVFMALTLGLGVCLLVAATKQFNIHQIEAVMFGSLLTVTDGDLLILLVTALAVIVVLARAYNALLFDSLNSPMARASGVDSARVEYLFVVLLTMAIVVSLKIIGALLVEALVVVPAAAARNLARSTRGYLGWSVLTALVTGVAGIFASTRLRVPTGGAVVLALGACFFLTLALGTLAALRGRGERG